MSGSRPQEQAELPQIEALLRQQRLAEALQRAEKFIARHPRNAAGFAAAVRCLLPTGRLARASDFADRGLRVAPSDESLHLLKGVLEHRLGQSDAAIERLSRVLARGPANAVEVSFALAEAMHRAGRREELDAFVAKGGAWLQDERAVVFAARALQRTDRAGAQERLQATARETRSALLKRIAGFEAVRMLDADARYAEALELAQYVHRETTPPFDVGAIEADVEAQLRLAAKGRPWFEPRGPAASATAFVVGLPRSGTTLLEQMLDRHPQVSGIGEYEGAFAIHEALIGLGVWPNDLRSLLPADAARLAADYLEGAVARRRAGAAWTFDKTLHVWRLMPAIAAVLPGAAFVHITRDARDTAISMHLSNFHPKSWGFTATLPAIRRVIELERRLVPQMAKLLGLRFVHVRYEDLVAEPEREIRRVLGAMGVEFEAAVLAPEQNARTVLTLSYEQVRRPINRSSIGRWRNYAFAFDAAWDALDAAGDAVA